MKIKANGISFNCQVDGREGAPWVVFSNSLMTNLSMWDEQAAALSGDFRVLRYDQRGHGGSDAPPGAYSFDVLTADAVALFNAFGIAKAHFVGLSMGGMTAVALAGQHPHRVERLVPCDCGPASTPQSAQQWAERIALAQEKGMEALVEPTVGRWFAAEFLNSDKAAVDKVRAMVRTTPLNGFAGCAQALSNFDLRPNLAGIKHPTLFLCGAKDAALGGTKALNAGVAGSKLMEIPDAGHISNIENPTMFTRALREFLSAP
ncbi:MAG TPA: alpha/beta fold hydrolase [Micropepsaceae bacterium]|jgi:3-oxoadipate enol-lactonase